MSSLTRYASAAWIKVCGITNQADAEVAIDAGAHAIGINLWPQSPRHVDFATAQKLTSALRRRIDVVLVVVNLTLPALQQALTDIAPHWLQLHGDEPDTWVSTLAPHAFRALGLAHANDVERAVTCPGPWVLVDARDTLKRGGTGAAPPQPLSQAVCSQRRTVLAGGLGPDNVAEAIQSHRPWGVDATSKLERVPGQKDAEAVRAYVAAAQSAFAALTTQQGVSHV